MVSKPSPIPFLQETLQIAGQLLRDRFGQALQISTKPDRSIVTDADLASEKLILERIGKYFPEDIIFSEESGKSTTDRPEGKAVWIIDPLDGTSNFANRYPFFCVSIGRGRFLKSGEIAIECGGIIDPVREKIYWAEKGGGAFCNSKKLQVGTQTDIGKAFVVTGFYYQKGKALEDEIARFAKVAEHSSTIRRDGAAALDMALVAEGVYDAFWERGLAPWDIAAGSIIIKEAHGRVANYDIARDYSLEGDGLVTGNGAMVTAIGTLIN